MAKLKFLLYYHKFAVETSWIDRAAELPKFIEELKDIGIGDAAAMNSQESKKVTFLLLVVTMVIDFCKGSF